MSEALSGLDLKNVFLRVEQRGLTRKAVVSKKDTNYFTMIRQLLENVKGRDEPNDNQREIYKIIKKARPPTSQRLEKTVA